MRTFRKGFTLVELMLAVLILAIMMSIVYGVVVSTVNAAHRVEEITASSEIGPAILTQVRSDLEAAFQRAGYMRLVDLTGDHRPPTATGPDHDWEKQMYRSPSIRPTHIHVFVQKLR